MFLSIILGIALLLLFILIGYSPGIIAPFTDNNGKTIPKSLAEKIFIPIGGIQQGMFICSKDSNFPVLLYLHGGPAFPNFFLIDKFKPGLEKLFTVCYWEQRGGGLSYSSQVAAASMNYQQLASDALEVSNYLRNRFGKTKIYIMAHSGGTPIALLAVSKVPEWYAAYIGMGQITHQLQSEKITYAYLLDRFRKTGEMEKVRQLEKFAVKKNDAEVYRFYSSSIRDQYMHKLGIGTMHNMHSVFREIFVPVWTCKAYTLREKWNIWKSKFSFLPKTNLIHEMLETDFTMKVRSLDIPVYFFSGQYDYTVNIDLAKAYLKQLHAPLKGFYTFQHSAHSPLFEEPALVRKIMEEDVLNNKTSLADQN